jgi:hypothetical protein
MARVARKRGFDRGVEIAGAVWTHPVAARARGALVAAAGVGLAAALVTWNVTDASLNASSAAAPGNAQPGRPWPTPCSKPWAWRGGWPPCCFWSSASPG